MAAQKVYVVTILGYDTNGNHVEGHAVFGDAERAHSYCRGEARRQTSRGRVYEHEVPGPPAGVLVAEFSGYDQWLADMQDEYANRHTEPPEDGSGDDGDH